MKIAFIAIFLIFLLSEVLGHGLMTEPPQRGTLGGNKFAPFMKNPIAGAPRDVFAHFPAGDKDTTPGAGKRSQEKEGKFNWDPFEPMKKGFVWRSGVCGDLKSAPQDHLRGGRYYFNGTISRVFPRGGIVKVGTSIIAHHNGYIEMHVCDVKQCGGEISEKCFLKGHCHRLNRARNRVCDGGLSKDCAPIDRNFPGRWYLPCSRNPSRGYDIFAPEFAQFVLPDRLTCDHCVLHWFWTSANNCNPPGVVEYFEGPDGPKVWGNCPGQAGALGGYTSVQEPCGGREFPEEYYQCADIKITNDAARSGRGKVTTSTTKREPEPSESPRSTPSPFPSSKTKVKAKDKRAEKRKTKKQKKEEKQKKQKNDEKPKKDAGNPFKNIKLVTDGHVIRKISQIDKFKNLKFKDLTFKVNTYREIKPIDFYIDGKKVWTEYTAPYYMFGNSGNMPYYWPDPIMNRRFTLEVRAGEYSYKVSVKLINK